jgi:hypothetical protein
MGKYYVVPAEIIESNFPDDMETLIQNVAVIETEKSITEIAEDLLKIKP